MLLTARCWVAELRLVRPDKTSICMKRTFRSRIPRFLRTSASVLTWRDWSLRIVAFAAKKQKYDAFHAAVRLHCSSYDFSAGHHWTVAKPAERASRARTRE